MSKFSEYLKDRKEKDEKWFYGESVHHVSNQYFKFDHVIDEDTAIIITANIRYIKGNPVMVIDRNKAIYLKEWQYRPIHIYDLGFDGYAVKINRNYFKPYEFKFDFDEFSFDEEQTFDVLKRVASEQNETAIAAGHMNF